MKKEMAVKYKEYSNLFFMDDKYCCSKVGEPNHPVVSIEQSKLIIVTNGMPFAVADHNFTKCKFISSVIMQAKILNLIEKLFYYSTVHVGLKDPIFEPSSARRHTSELYNIIDKINKLYLFLYTDGGSDYQVKFIKI
jgi:hypothetical protein